MMPMTAPSNEPTCDSRRLEFLRDGRGIYGMSIPKSRWDDGHNSITLIVRPDRLPTQEWDYMYGALQILPAQGFRHAKERVFARELGEAMAARAGLIMGDWDKDGEWWSGMSRSMLKM